MGEPSDSGPTQSGELRTVHLRWRGVAAALPALASPRWGSGPGRQRRPCGPDAGSGRVGHQRGDAADRAGCAVRDARDGRRRGGSGTRAGPPAHRPGRTGSTGHARRPGHPRAALAAYHRAAGVIGNADPACHIDWALIAAIGRVESDHGRYGGNTLGAAGIARPGHLRHRAGRRGRHGVDPGHRQRRVRPRHRVGPRGRADAVHPRHLADRRRRPRRRRREGPAGHQRRFRRDRDLPVRRPGQPGLPVRRVLRRTPVQQLRQLRPDGAGDRRRVPARRDDAAPVRPAGGLGVGVRSEVRRPSRKPPTSSGSGSGHGAAGSPTSGSGGNGPGGAPVAARCASRTPARRSRRSSVASPRTCRRCPARCPAWSARSRRSAAGSACRRCPCRRRAAPRRHRLRAVSHALSAAGRRRRRRAQQGQRPGDDPPAHARAHAPLTIGSRAPSWGRGPLEDEPRPAVRTGSATAGARLRMTQADAPRARPRWRPGRRCRIDHRAPSAPPIQPTMGAPIGVPPMKIAM